MRRICEQDVLIPGRVVRAGASASGCVVASPVAHADVEMAVLAELKVAAVVVPGSRVDVRDQGQFARRVDEVIVPERETRDAVRAGGAARGPVT